MKKYRKKPIIIEALQWTGENFDEIVEFLENRGKPEGCMYLLGEHFYMDFNKVKGGLIIKTLEGEHIATIGDYIIKGVQGEFYPCKANIFEATYEEVEDTQK